MSSHDTANKPTPEPTDVEQLIAAGERCRPHDPAHRTDCACVHCLAAALAAALRTAQTREREWKTWGIVEIAVRNPNVASYMDHWEKRTDKVERECAALREQLQVVEHQRDVANQYVQMREDEIATLRAQIDAVNKTNLRLADKVNGLQIGRSQNVSTIAALRAELAAVEARLNDDVWPMAQRALAEASTLRAQVQQARELLKAIYCDRWLNAGATQEQAQIAAEKSVDAALLSPTGGD